MTEVPDLQYYKTVISRNGGPIAFMLKENTFFFGKKDDTKNYIFIFSSYGKLINAVNLKEKIPSLRENQKWVAFHFTEEEDLFILSDGGELYFIDPKTGEFRDKEPIKLRQQFQINKLVDSRFDQQTNQIVLRNCVCEFFFIKNIQTNPTQIQDFQKSSYLEERGAEDESLVADYILIPAEKSGSTERELLVADPDEGFHQLFIKPGYVNEGAHHKDLSYFSHG